MPAITLHSYRDRDELTRKWRLAQYKVTGEHALAVYGEGNYELIAGSAVTYEGGDPISTGASRPKPASDCYVSFLRQSVLTPPFS